MLQLISREPRSETGDELAARSMTTRLPSLTSCCWHRAQNNARINGDSERVDIGRALGIGRCLGDRIDTCRQRCKGKGRRYGRLYDLTVDRRYSPLMLQCSGIDDSGVELFLAVQYRTSACGRETDRRSCQDGGVGAPAMSVVGATLATAILPVLTDAPPSLSIARSSIK